MKAYLKFGGAALGIPKTIAVECKAVDAPWSGRTVSGYGSRIPAPYMVRHNGKWRRVYVAQYGNAGTAYIGKPGAWEAIIDDIEESE